LTRIPDELPVEPQTPDAIIGKLNEVINAGLAETKIKTRVADPGGMERGPGVRAAFQAVLKRRPDFLFIAFDQRLFTHFR
jgi:hypothetical protein